MMYYYIEKEKTDDLRRKASEAILKTSTRVIIWVEVIEKLNLIFRDKQMDGTVDRKMVEFKEYCYDKRIRKSYFNLSVW